MAIGKIAITLKQFTKKYHPENNEHVVHIGSTADESVKFVYMKANTPNLKRYHPHVESTFCVLEGTGKCFTNDEWKTYNRGDVIVVKGGARQQIYPTADTLFLNTQHPLQPV